MACLLELFMVTFHPVQPKTQIQRVFHDANYKSHQTTAHPHSAWIFRSPQSPVPTPSMWD
jgi:hypothetical protein